MLAWLALLVCAVGASSGSAATSGTVVGATVPSATNLTPGGCPPGSIGVTGFGPLSVATSTVTSGNCVIVFGSSNDVARLRVAQSDRLGSAMYRPTTGAFDPTFSGDGVATFAPSGGDDVASSVAVQADGKVVIAGTVDDGGTRRPMVARLDTAGVLDGSFGSGGVRSFPTLASHAWSQPQVTLDAQGNVLLAFVDAVAFGSVKVVRLLPTDGSNDPLFGAGGVATHAISGGGNTAWINDIAVDATGRILLGGRTWPAPEWGWFPFVLRLGPTGGFDNTYGGGDGLAVPQCPGTTGSDGLTDLLVHADGSITATGLFYGTPNRVHAVRMNATTGAIDGGFGTGGCTQLPAVGGSGLAMDSSGRFYAGTGGGVTRLAATGLVDGSFGIGGTSAIGGAPRELAVDVDGTVVVGWLDGSFRTTRLSSTGGLVTTHGTGGTATITVGADAGMNEVTDMVLAPDGHVVQVARDTSNGTAYDIVAVRTETSRVANYGAGQDWVAGGANGVFGACLRDATNGAVSDGTTWTSNLGVACPAANGGGLWRGIPETTGDPAALVARTNVANDQDATATLQFGFRTAAAQPAGTYLAPVTFEVVAP